MHTHLYIAYTILYIAEVEIFCGCKTKLQFAGKHLQLDGSLVWPKLIAQAISPEKFHAYRSIHKNHETFTLNDLQYTVHEHSNNEFTLDTLIILAIPGLSQRMECFLQNLCTL